MPQSEMCLMFENESRTNFATLILGNLFVYEIYLKMKYRKMLHTICKHKRWIKYFNEISDVIIAIFTVESVINWYINFIYIYLNLKTKKSCQQNLSPNEIPFIYITLDYVPLFCHFLTI